MNIQLSDHFPYRKLMRFTFPSILMLIFTSIYGVVDGFFVSNYVGKTPFAALNFIMPFLMILGAVGFMFGTGGGALIAKTMGEGKQEEASQIFSLFIYVTAILGVVLAVLGILFIGPIAAALGAEGELLRLCIVYGRVCLLALPALMLQYEFQSFFSTAEKPQMGLIITILAGVTNIVLDALFIAVLNGGLVAAAAATVCGQLVGGIIPVFYFARKNPSPLRLTRTAFDKSALWKACTNGSSELMSNISMSVVSMLYNAQLMKYAGENGVAAYGVLMYVNLIFLAAFIGYSVGAAPIISYHFGAGHRSELSSLLKKSLRIIFFFSVSMLALSQILAKPLSPIFVGYDLSQLTLMLLGFQIFSFSFLFSGAAIFGSAFFTALNNGLVSALISFLRTLLFQVAAVLIFPLIWQIDGIWMSVAAAEFLAAAVTALFILAMRKKYQY